MKWLITCIFLVALVGCEALPPDLSDPGNPLGGQPLPPVDSDDDGVADYDDNCVLVANADQTDTDGDGVGDACTLIFDFDSDFDGVLDYEDNCPLTPNPDQADSDGDGRGDACTLIFDTDGDGIPDGEDNCLFTPNPDQADSDGDGIGDACEISMPDGTCAGGGIIESKIDGASKGFDGDTLFVLTNGQIWQQDEYYYHYHYSYRPDVLIVCIDGVWKIQIEGIDRFVRVVRLR